MKQGIDEFIEKLIIETKTRSEQFGWNKNDIMRFVYIQLGSKLSKSMDFFYSREGKYGHNGLTIKQMKKIHEQQANFEVTCKVTAQMLKRIYDAVGINCEIRNSVTPQIYEHNGEPYPIYHSYLIAQGEKEKLYFLSLNNDLVNIKSNAKTSCFGAKIPYFYNGTQNYPGNEILYSTFSAKELLQIDKKI